MPTKRLKSDPITPDLDDDLPDNSDWHSNIAFWKDLGIAYWLQALVEAKLDPLAMGLGLALLLDYTEPGVVELEAFSAAIADDFRHTVREKLRAFDQLCDAGLAYRDKPTQTVRLLLPKYKLDELVESGRREP